MILETTNLCKDVQLLNILTIFKSLIKFCTIIVPVILVIFVIIDIIKTISSNDVDTKKLFKSISKRLIAAIFIFLIPFIIDLIIGIIPTGKFYYRDCYDKASKSELESTAYQNFEDSLNKLKASLKDCNSKHATCYNESYLNYEQARKDLKLIPKGTAKTSAESQLEEQKKIFDKIK